MPNHIANEITGPGLAEIRQLLAGERPVDFRRVIPQPEGLDIEPHLGIIDAAKVACKDWPKPDPRGGVHNLIPALSASNMERQKSPLEFDDEEWRLFIQCLENKRATGYYTWYEWNTDHWGTKWNAYAIEDRGESIYFETAWSFPEPVMRAIVEKLPGIEFTWRYADEDFGNNLGIWWAGSDGVQHRQPEVDDLEEWAAKLHGWDDEAIAEMRRERAEEEAAESREENGNG